MQAYYACNYKLIIEPIMISTTATIKRATHPSSIMFRESLENICKVATVIFTEQLCNTALRNLMASAVYYNQL